MHARPAESGCGQTGVIKFVPHYIVRDFLAAVFEQECGGDIRVREVAAVGAAEHLKKCVARGAACLGVRERDEAGDALRAANLPRVQTLGGEP